MGIKSYAILICSCKILYTIDLGIHAHLITSYNRNTMKTDGHSHSQYICYACSIIITQMQQIMSRVIVGNFCSSEIFPQI